MGAAELLTALRAARSADTDAMWRTAETIAKAVDAAITAAPSPSAYDKKWQTTCLSAIMATIERLTDPNAPSQTPPQRASVGLSTAVNSPKASKPEKDTTMAPRERAGQTIPPSWAAPQDPTPSSASPPPTYANVVGQATDQSKASTTRTATKAPPKDDRVFLRATPGDPIRDLSPSECRLLVIQKLKLANTDVRSVFRTAGGWGFLFTPVARAKVLDAKIPNMRFEASTKWHTYVVSRVPRTAMTLEGLSLTEPMLKGEAERSTGREPIRVVRSRFSAEADPWQTWLFSFTGPVKGPFTIFDSDRARPVVDTVRIVQCPTCLAFHGPKPCSARPKCPVCGKAAHPPASEKSLCLDLPKCANCNGPHEALAPSCPARPTVDNGRIRRPTTAQLAAIRQAGAVAWKATLGKATQGAPSSPLILPSRGTTIFKDPRGDVLSGANLTTIGTRTAIAVMVAKDGVDTPMSDIFSPPNSATAKQAEATPSGLRGSRFVQADQARRSQDTEAPKERPKPRKNPPPKYPASPIGRAGGGFPKELFPETRPHVTLLFKGVRNEHVPGWTEDEVFQEHWEANPATRGFPVLAGDCWPSEAPGALDWSVMVGWGFDKEVTIGGAVAAKTTSLAPPNRETASGPPPASASPPPPSPPTHPHEAGQTVHLLGMSLEDEDDLTELQLLQKAWEEHPLLAQHQVKHALSRPSETPGLTDWQLVVSTLCPVPFTIGGAVSAPGTFVKADKAVATTFLTLKDPSWTDASSDFAASQGRHLLEQLLAEDEAGEITYSPVEKATAPPTRKADTNEEASADTVMVPADQDKITPATGGTPRPTPSFSISTRASAKRGRGGGISKPNLKANRTASPLRSFLLPTQKPPHGDDPL
jgi:hypothetical protein